MRCYYPNSRSYLGFSRFPMNTLSLSQDPIWGTTLRLVITFSYSHRACDSFSSPFYLFVCLFVFMSLTVLRGTGQVFCTRSLSPGFSRVVHMIGPGLWVFGKNTKEAKCPSHHIL